MENSNQYDEILIKYLLNELKSAEEKDVLQWINVSEENRQYFEHLKNTWTLTSLRNLKDQVDVEKEWQHFKQLTSIEEQERNVGEIIEIEKPERGGSIYRTIRAAAVAASVLLIIGLGYKYLINQHQKTEVAQVEVDKPKDNLAAFIRVEKNTSGKPKKLVLQDGSEIVLANKSEVSFPEPFTDNKRDITLHGKADFKVAKDKLRPFTVFSGDISTTALGTQFRVTAFDNKTSICVRLYEGKVVVKSVATAKLKLKDFFDLLPGQELVYNKEELTAKIRNYKENDLVVKRRNNKENIYQDNPSLPQNQTGPWDMFNNQALGYVFDDLANMYNVEIVYSKKDVDNKYFIGKFDKSDSIETIIKQIAALNNLKVIKKNNRYIIKK